MKLFFYLWSIKVSKLVPKFLHVRQIAFYRTCQNILGLWFIPSREFFSAGRFQRVRFHSLKTLICRNVRAVGLFVPKFYYWQLNWWNGITPSSGGAGCLVRADPALVTKKAPELFKSCHASSGPFDRRIIAKIVMEWPKTDVAKRSRGCFPPLYMVWCVLNILRQCRS